jgi:hypothetical protein
MFHQHRLTKDVNSSTNIPVQQKKLTTPKSPLFFQFPTPKLMGDSFTK